MADIIFGINAKMERLTNYGDPNYSYNVGTSAACCSSGSSLNGVCQPQCSIPSNTMGMNDDPLTATPTAGVTIPCAEASGFSGTFSYKCINGVYTAVSNNCTCNTASGAKIVVDGASNYCVNSLCCQYSGYYVSRSWAFNTDSFYMCDSKLNWTNGSHKFTSTTPKYCDGECYAAGKTCTI